MCLVPFPAWYVVEEEGRIDRPAYPEEGNRGPSAVLEVDHEPVDSLVEDVTREDVAVEPPESDCAWIAVTRMIVRNHRAAGTPAAKTEAVAEAASTSRRDPKR